MMARFLLRKNLKNKISVLDETMYKMWLEQWL